VENNKLRVGIAGYGVVGKRRHFYIDQNPNMKVVAVCDKNKDLEERASLVPLKRGGAPEEVAALIIYLLSGRSNYITGQMFAITGGDWL
jgi:NAD(P)-dependent dehydrogenase (short-subunit alcohol dehydrogenase family)|tara:strand:+ start:241 stop:507 length:267 start_codon:yes stop_codon:yes gene_type:complete